MLSQLSPSSSTSIDYGESNSFSFIGSKGCIGVNLYMADTTITGIENSYIIFEFIKKKTYFCSEGNLICTSISYKASIRHYSMRWYDNLVNSTHYSVHAWVSNKTYLEASFLEIWGRCMTGKKGGCFTDKYFKIFTFRAFILFAILFNTVVRCSQERIQQVWLWKS
jgi:hypothetical protein